MASSHDLVLTTVPGGNALSPFRSAALLARLQRVVPGLTAVTARHVHWVASDGPLDEATTATVERLLTYGPPDAGDADGAHVAVVVVAPRLGTLVALGLEGHGHRAQLRCRRAPGRAGHRVPARHRGTAHRGASGRRPPTCSTTG